MSKDTLYYSVTAGEPLRTRAVLPYSLIKHFKLDIALSEPDEHFPSEFPGAFVPAFRYADGRILTESMAIAFLLADKLQNQARLLGDNSADTIAEIMQWINFMNMDLMSGITVQFTMVLGRRPFNHADWGRAGGLITKCLTILNGHLTKNTYLVGESVTLADLYGVTMLLRGLQVLWGRDVRAKFPAVLRWFNTVSKSAIFDGFFETLEMPEEGKRPKELHQ